MCIKSIASMLDHITLEYGDGNGLNNLVALCTECQGKKTAIPVRNISAMHMFKSKKYKAQSISGIVLVVTLLLLFAYSIEHIST